MGEESVTGSSSNCTDYRSSVEMIENANSDAFFNTLPPGIRFCPQDSELIVHYLWPKVLNKPLPHNKIFDVNIYLYNPDHLADMFHKFGEKEWYFFTSRDRKYPNGKRPNRAAGDGYWKATGADRKIFHDGNLVGYRKTLVFYQGKAQQGTKTNWIMHEFRVDHPPARKRNGPADMTLDAFILSRIYKKTEGRATRVDPFPLPEQGQGLGLGLGLGDDDEEMSTQQQQQQQQCTSSHCPLTGGTCDYTHTSPPDNWYSDQTINTEQPLPLPLPLYSSSPYRTAQTPFIHSHTNTFGLNSNPHPLLYAYQEPNSMEIQDYTFMTTHHHQHQHQQQHLPPPPPPTFREPKHENCQFPTR